MACLGNILLENTAQLPERPAVVCDDRSLTYRQLNTESNRLANALKRIGVRRGDKLAMLMVNSVEWLLVWSTCQKLGVSAVLVHARMLPEELARTVTLTEASTIIYSKEYAVKASYIASDCDCIRRAVECGVPDEASVPDGHIAWSSLMSGDDVSEAQEALTGEEDCVVLFTSGTTGLSKGIERTNEMMCRYSQILTAEYGSRPDREVMLTPAPLYHAAGLCCVVKMLALAGTLVLVNGFDPEKICRQIDAQKATQIALVPPRSYQRLKQSGYTDKYDFTSVRLAHITAGKALEDCIEDIFSLFPNAKLRSSWGSTEASNITSAILSQEQLRADPKLMHTVGRLNSVSEIKLMDKNGRPVPVGKSGEAYVRSPLVFHGYIKACEKTKRCFDNGWFKTEDVLERDDEGYYYLLDRKRDIVKTGGENVYSLDVERVIQSHPSVRECAVVGIPDPKFDEAIAAAIVLKPGCSLSSLEFIDFCKKNLPSFKKPRYWAILDNLPENDVGKVVKNELCRNADKLFTAVKYK